MKFGNSFAVSGKVDWSARIFAPMARFGFFQYGRCLPVADDLGHIGYSDWLKAFGMASETQERKEHWEGVYRSKDPDEVSWHQDVPSCSLALIEQAGLPRTAPIIDVGGGASRLVDHLLALAYEDLTVLDICGVSLDRARSRLGVDSERVQWIEADVTAFDPPRSYALWHDRAAFHFLTSGKARRQYVDVLRRSLQPGGQLIIATFAPDGPQRCSGLEIVRYDADSLSRVLGSSFRLLESRRETHLTPQGREQRFGFHRFARVA